MMALLLGIGLAAQAGEGDLWRYDSADLRVLWLPELAATVGTFFIWRALEVAPPRQTGQEWSPSSIDGAIAPQWSPRAQRASDLLAIPTANHGLNLPVLGLLGLGLTGTLTEDLGQGAAYGLIFTESILATAALTGGVKDWVARPRPYTADRFAQAWPQAASGLQIQEDLGAEGHFDAFKSFPSGHSSVAMAMGTTAAGLLWNHERRRQARPWVAATAYGGAAALGLTTASLRVKGGMHHPTDTLAGLALGAGVGWLIPWAHEQRELDLSLRPGGLAVAGRW